VLVLEGEQHLWDVHPDGSRGAHRVRRAGDYALSTGDAHPHLERGGERAESRSSAATRSDGLLYELTDENGKVFLGRDDRLAREGLGGERRRDDRQGGRRPTRSEPKASEGGPLHRGTQAHIAGIGETRYARWGKIGDVTEHALALEAITRAVADAGLTIDDVDGLASFADDRNEAIYLAAELGLPALRFGNMVWMPGGGGGCAAVGNAAMAVETGQAEVVVVYRSLCQGQFFRFGSGGLDASAPVAAPPKPTVNQTGSLMMAWMAFAMPYGLIQAAAAYALPTRRHMHLYGTTGEQLGRIAVTFREHASRNPRAVMGNKPMTLADHQASPMIADPHSPVRLLSRERRRVRGGGHHRGARARPREAADRDPRQRAGHAEGLRVRAVHERERRRRALRDRRAARSSRAGSTRRRASVPATSTSRRSTTTSPAAC
jgi:hypothetical protein